MEMNQGSGTPAGRRRVSRFWVAVCLFALANAGAWVGYHQLYGPGRHHLLRVEQFGPGDRAVVSGRPYLSWQFNLDVAEDRAGGSGGPPAVIAPAVAGKFKWQDRRNLLFVPEQDLPRATRFTVTIPPQRLRTPEGFRMPGAFVATILTEPLRALAVRQSSFEEHGRYVLDFEFNDRVIPADLSGKLKLTGPDGKPLGFKLHGDAAEKIVRVLTDSITFDAQSEEAQQVIAVIDRGLAGVSGPLGLEEPVEMKVSVGSTLMATRAEAHVYGHGKPELSVCFNGEPDLAALREVLSVEPKVSYSTEKDYRGVMLAGDFVPGRRYTIKIADPPKGSDRKKYPRAETLSVFVPDRPASAWFERDSGYLGSKGNRTLLAHAVNISEVKVQVWRVYDNNLVEWRNSSGRYRWQRDLRGYAKPVATRMLNVSGERNAARDLKISLDDLIPAMEAKDGVYRVTLSAVNTKNNRHGEDDDEDYYYYDRSEYGSCVVTLSDLGISAKQTADGMLVWVTSLSTARPVEGARVRVFSNKNQLLGEGTSGGDGVVTLKKFALAEGESAAVVLACGGRQGDKGTRGQGEGEDVEEKTIGWQPMPQDAHGRDARSTSLTWMDLRSGQWDLADLDVSGRAWQRSGHEAFVYTDRGGYRPGETVHLRAIVRRCDGSAVRAMPVRWLIRRPDLREWKQQMAKVDADGSVGLDLVMPDDVTTGQWTAELGLPGEPTASSTFGRVTYLVEEFVPNRLKVGLKVQGKALATDADGSQRATIGAESLRAHVQADYLFGRPGAGLSADLSVRLDPGHFSPASFKGWSFGDSAGVIGTSASLGAVPVTKLSVSPEMAQHTLDEKGHGEWQLDVKKYLGAQLAPATRPATQPAAASAVAAMRFRGPWDLAMTATVQETGGRSASAADSIRVDALPWYIGVRRSAEGSGASLSPAFEIALVRPSGSAADEDAKLSLSLLRESWNNTLIYREGRYRYDSHRVLEPVTEATREVEISQGKGSIQVSAPVSGAYVLCAADRATGAMTSVRFYASNGDPWEDNVSREHPERLEVVILPPGKAPDEKDEDELARKKAKFRVGDTAKALVRSPFAGRLLLTVETDRIVQTKVIEMKASSVEVPLEVSEGMLPNAYVSASVIRAIDPNAKWRTHRAYGAARISVDTSDRKLDVAIDAPKEIRPLSAMSVSVRVKYVNGKPAANAPVTVAAVDEGVLALTNFQTPSPMGFFYGIRALGVQTHDIFGELMPEVPKPDKTSAVGGDGVAAGGGRYHSPVTTRRVKCIALFTAIKTDENGVAATNFAVPEFVGQLRLMAVAHDAQRFGSGSEKVLVRSPLLVQSSLPRFAAPGDRFDAPVTLFNNGEKDLNVTFAAELLDGNAGLAFAGSDQTRIVRESISIPAGRQHVLNLMFTAGQRIGNTRIKLTAQADGETAQETTELPIRPASPMISTGGFAILSPEKPYDLVLKNDFLPGTERSTVSLSRMPTVSLPQGLEYLERYPYGCAEQTVSTAFPLIYLDELGPMIAPGVFEKNRVAHKVQVGISRLIGMQTAEGAMAMWPGSREPWPWASVYAAHFLTEARAAGHAVPDGFYKRLMGYVRSLLSKSGDNGELLELQAYAGYVLALSGKPDRAFMSRMAELTRGGAKGADELAMRAQARLYVSLAWLASGRRDLAAQLLPASLPPVRQTRQGGGNVGSSVRDRAMLLNTLLTVQPDHEMVPALTQQLSEAKWQSTQDVAFAVMALGKYLRQTHTQEPYDRGELLLEGKSIASGGGTIGWTLPPDPSEGSPEQRAFAAKIEGPQAARGYLSWVRSGVPKVMPKSEDHGIKIRRRYLDERQRPIESLVVPSGSMVIVELTIEGSPNQKNVVIEDLLPAGLEIENPRLETNAARTIRRPVRGEDDPTDENLHRLRMDMRDDRMLLFGDLPAGGIVKHVYAARAVVQGNYVLPPCRVECMYDMATNSLWSPGGTLRVEKAGGGGVVKNEVEE